MRFRRYILAVVALLAGGLAWHASLPAPAGPAQGMGLEGQVTRQGGDDRTHLAGNPLAEREEYKKSFRIGTFNIHGCKGLDGRRDVDRVAACLRGLDVVALNEVRGPRLWEKTDQAARLAERQGMAWLFAPSQRNWHCVELGNGLVSVLPVASWQRTPLDRRSGRGYRNAVHAEVQHRGRTVHVLLTHIARSDVEERQQQLAAVITMYLALPEPAVLLGDLNSHADDPQLACLLALPGVGDPVGEKLGEKAPRRIDWIITRGLRMLDAGLLENDASDHPLVWAEVE